MVSRSNGPNGRTDVPRGSGPFQFEYNTASTDFPTNGIQCPGTCSNACSARMVLAYMQRTTRSRDGSSDHSIVFRMAQPLVLLLLRSVSTLHANGSQNISCETQIYQADHGSNN